MKQNDIFFTDSTIVENQSSLNDDIKVKDINLIKFHEQYYG